MKTLQELYDEVITSEELKKEFIETQGKDAAVQAFLKKYGCEAKTEEVMSFIREKADVAAAGNIFSVNKKSGTFQKLSDDDLRSVAGGHDKSVNVNIIISTKTGNAGCGGVNKNNPANPADPDPAAPDPFTTEG